MSISRYQRFSGLALAVGGVVLASCSASPGHSARPPRPASSSTTPAVASFAAPDPSTLWVQVTDGAVYYSADGGASWSNRTPAAAWVQTAQNGGQAFQNPLTQGSGFFSAPATTSAAWLAEGLPDGTIQVARTTDEGRSWKLSTLPKSYPEGHNIVGVSFLTGLTSTNGDDRPDGWVSVSPTANTAYASSDIFQSTDGGTTWSYETTDAASDGGPVEFVSTQVGFDGKTHDATQLLATSDGGTTWSAAALPMPPGTAIGIPDPYPTFTDGLHGFDYADFYRMKAVDPHLPYMYETSDGGTTWSLVKLPMPPSRCTSACSNPSSEGQVGWSGWWIVSPTDWFLAGQDTIMHTTDGGSTWTTVVPDRVLTDLHGIEFPSDQVGYALVDTSTCSAPATASGTLSSPCPPGFAILRTTDGGATWNEVATP